MAEQKNTTDGERSSLPASPTDENAREAIEAVRFAASGASVSMVYRGAVRPRL